jgi:hypothetical protein
MTEQQPMSTTYAPEAPRQPGERSAVEQRNAEAEAEQQRLNKQVYDYRKTCDPLLYERVIAFHQMANTSDEAFATFAADYDRAAAEHLPPPEPPPEDGATRQA